MTKRKLLLDLLDISTTEILLSLPKCKSDGIPTKQVVKPYVNQEEHEKQAKNNLKKRNAFFPKKHKKIKIRR